MIDEAHERSISTDIILGMAKLKLKEKAGTFHVVVASATIDPRGFMTHFGFNENNVDNLLNVEGKIFPINEIYEPIKKTKALVNERQKKETLYENVNEIVDKAIEFI